MKSLLVLLNAAVALATVVAWSIRSNAAWMDAESDVSTLVNVDAALEIKLLIAWATTTSPWVI
jgi:hypothetical protein